MKLEKELNHLGKIFASIFSVILFLSLILGSVFGAFVNAVNPKNVAEIIQNADSDFSVKNGTAVKAVSKAFNINSENAEKLISDPLSKKAISQLIEFSFIKVYGGKTEETAEEFSKTVTENPEHFAEILSESFPDRLEGKTKEEIAEKISEFAEDDSLFEYIDKYSEDLISKVKSRNEFSIILNVFSKGTVLLINISFILLCLFLYGVIFAIRFPKFEGFMWNGITLSVSSVFIIIAGIFIKRLDIGLFGEVGKSFFALTSLNILSRGILMLILGGVSILLYFLINRKNKGKNGC